MYMINVVTCGKDLLQSKYVNALRRNCFTKLHVFTLSDSGNAVEKV